MMPQVPHVPIKLRAFSLPAVQLYMQVVPDEHSPLQQSVAQSPAPSPEATHAMQVRVVVSQAGPAAELAQSVSVAQHPGVPPLQVPEARHVYVMLPQPQSAAPQSTVAAWPSWPYAVHSQAPASEQPGTPDDQVPDVPPASGASQAYVTFSQPQPDSPHPMVMG
jgi:hypothetical protein